MNRFLIASVLALAASSPALAQDMPLSQILISGEGWQKVNAPSAHLNRDRTTLSADRATVFIAVAGERFLWAAPATAEGKPATAGAPYAPLRLARGEKAIEVTGLATDRDGRIYAATALGVQVFDPTGRPCGVLTPAAEGAPAGLAFEGDKLTHWIKGEKYVRRLNTSGAK